MKYIKTFEQYINEGDEPLNEKVNFKDVHKFIKDISKEKPELEWKLGGNHNNVYSGRIKGAQFGAIIWVGDKGEAGRISSDNPGGEKHYDSLEDFYRVIVQKKPAKGKGSYKAYKRY